LSEGVVSFHCLKFVSGTKQIGTNVLEISVLGGNFSGNCKFSYHTVLDIVLLLEHHERSLVNVQLDAQLRNIILFYYYNPLHVSNISVLIIMRSNCINTVSGIVFTVSDRPVCKLRTCIPDVTYR